MQHAVDPGIVRGPDADRHADRHRCEGRRDDEHDGLDGRRPQVLVDDEQEPDDDAGGQLPGFLQPPGKAGYHQDKQDRRHGEEEIDQRVERRLEAVSQRVEEPGEVGRQKVEEGFPPFADRDLAVPVGNPLRNRIHVCPSLRS